eukprot:m51a1_g14325 putative atp-dependent dna helicase (636) ;mRNA; r:72344-79845
MDATALAALCKRVFGHSALRPQQAAACAAVLSGRDCFLPALAIGRPAVVVSPLISLMHDQVQRLRVAGVRACYLSHEDASAAPLALAGHYSILPALAIGRPAVVVSPLISLMHDQVQRLRVAGVRACYLSHEDASAAPLALAGHYSIVYVTPERVVGWLDELRARYGEAGLALFAVDEAHCVSEWGHEFRPEYRMLGAIRGHFPSVPLVAVTATATPDVQRDIVAQLGLRDPLLLVGSFARENLFYSVRRKSGSAAADVGGVLCLPGALPAIVYTPTIQETDDLCAVLRNRSVAALPYNSTLSAAAKKHTHDSFLADAVQVVVATMSIVRRSALRGDEVVPFQCINWPDDTIQRRTVSVEYVCGDGVFATIKAQGRSCPVNRIGRCRVEATKPGTRKPSRTVYAYELLVRETQRRWFHESLVDVSGLALPSADQQQHQQQQQPTSSPSSPSASPSSSSSTPAELPHAALAQATSTPPLVDSPPPLPTSPYASLASAAAAVAALASNKRPRTFAAAEKVEAARRVGAALGRGDLRSAITLVLDVHELFPRDHLAVMQGIAAAPDAASALAALERKAEEEVEGFPDVLAALRDGFGAGRVRAAVGQAGRAFAPVLALGPQQQQQQQQQQLPAGLFWP